MIYNVYTEVEARNTAGLKAPADLAEICRKNGFRRFTIPPYPKHRSFIYTRLWLAATMPFYIFRLFTTLKKGDVILFQNLSYGVKPLAKAIPIIRKKKDCQFVILIHDLESLRKGISGVIENNQKRNDFADTVFLDCFDRIISHNQHMTDYLVKHNGINPDKIVNLGIFDYLTPVNRIPSPREDVPSIAIAGNLASGKCGYIYKIPAQNLDIHLYGNSFDPEKASPNMIYHGSFHPDRLPEQLVGDFGLVWDGDSANGCSGNTGEYLRYNNPHKTSLYLAANMPVIVWRHAAIADFVKENHVGIVIDDLSKLSEAIASVSKEEYESLLRNVARISEKLRSGYYFSTALKECQERQL